MIVRGNKRTYHLGELIKRGGEGCIYEIMDLPGSVAKLYHPMILKPTGPGKDPKKEIEEKLRHMLAHPIPPEPDGHCFATWPTDILYGNGGLVGFVMPKLMDGHKLFEACAPSRRKKLFNKYSWRSGLVVAFNLALTVEKIHSLGYAIGDMNTGNVQVDRRGRITLVDCDSFVIRTSGGKIYRSMRGRVDYIPPELQGKDYYFTKESDNFALAVHIFQLLMNNCHPFVCVETGKEVTGDVGANIRKGKCPYVKGNKKGSSPEAPSYTMLPVELRNLFVRAFDYDENTAVMAETVQKRPTATEWVKALRTCLGKPLKVCPFDASHVYPKSFRSSCPFCAAERRTTGLMGKYRA